MNQKSTIIKGTLILVIYYIIAKILSFLMEMLIAVKFGPCVETDSYYLVDGIILSISPMLSVGIWKLFMPEYKSRIVKNQMNEAAEITHRLILVFLLISILLTVIILLFSTAFVKIYAPGFDNNSIHISASILKLMVFTFILGTVTTFFSAILQSRNLFSKSQLKEIILFIPPVVYLCTQTSKFGIIGLAISVLIGYVLALISQCYLASPYYKISIRSNLINKETLNILKLYPVACINSVILQLSGVIGKMFSSTLAVGSITFLNYGGKIIHLFNGVFSMAISVAIFPYLTEILTRNRHTEIVDFIKHYLSVIFAILIPVALIILLFSEQIIDLLFGYGKFTDSAIRATSLILAMYGIGLLGMGLTTFIDDVFYIKKRIKTLLITTGVNLVCNVFFAFILIKEFDVAGLALASTLSLYISLTMKLYFIRNLIVVDKFVINNLETVTIAGLFSSFLILILRAFGFTSGIAFIDLIVGSLLLLLVYSTILLLHNSFYKQQCIELIIQRLHTKRP